MSKEKKKKPFNLFEWLSKRAEFYGIMRADKSRYSRARLNKIKKWRKHNKMARKTRQQQRRQKQKLSR